MKKYSCLFALLLSVVIFSCKKEDEEAGNENPDQPAVDTVSNLISADLLASNYGLCYDLGDNFVITKIVFDVKSSSASELLLSIFEASGNKNFFDALPLAIIKSIPVSGFNTYNIDCSKGFRYVRFHKNDSGALISSAQFYGYKSQGNNSKLVTLTNLPTVVINTQNNSEITSLETEIICYSAVVSSNFDFIEDTECKIRGRGNASWNFPKKPYRLRFSQKQSPLGSDCQAKKWTLINNYGDKTLMRNKLAFDISKLLGMAYTPRCYFVDLVLNGVYQGSYQLCDQVSEHKGRVEIDDEGFLIEVDAYAYKENSYFYSDRSTPVTIKYPDDQTITEAQSQAIKNYFNAMESAVLSGNISSSGLDLESFLKHFIVGELSGNTDTYWSVYMYKNSFDNRIFTGPCWDFDLAFDNDNRTYPVNNLNGFVYATAGSSAGDFKQFVNALINNQSVRLQLKNIWNNACNNGNLNADVLIDSVENYSLQLEQSQRLNFLRYPILNTYVHQNPQISGSYSGEVEVVKKYIRNRFPKMNSLLQ